jgi:hypothetical protein
LSASRLETQQFLKSTNFGKACEKTRTGPASAEKTSESEAFSNVPLREAEEASYENAQGPCESIVVQKFSPAEEEKRFHFGASAEGT